MRCGMLQVGIVCGLLTVWFADRIHAQDIWKSELLQKETDRDISHQSIALDPSGNPHIISTSDNLYYCWYDGSNWQTETVLSSPEPVTSASIAIGNDGTVHIIFYYDHSLYHACRKGLSWEFSELGRTKHIHPCKMKFNSQGELQTVFINDSDTLMHAAWDDGIWVLSTIATEAYSHGGWTFDLDSKDDPHVFFQSGYNLLYMHRKNSIWDSEIVHDASDYTTVFDLVLTAEDKPHLLFEKNGLRYIRSNETGWVTLLLDTGYHGLSSWFLDPDNGLHVVSRSGSLPTHFYQSGNHWEREILDPGNIYYGAVSAVSDHSGQAYLLLFNRTMSSLVCFSGTSYHWNQQTIANFGIIGNCAIAVEKNNDVHILYTVHSGNQLQYATRHDEQWRIEILDDLMSNESGQCNIAVDEQGAVHIIYYNALDRALYYAVKVNDEWQSEVVFDRSCSNDSKMAVTQNGSVFILVGTDENLYLLRKENAVWEKDALMPGLYKSISLCLDDKGSVHCAYYRFNDGGMFTQYSLYYRHLSDEGWIEEVVDGGNAGTGTEKLDLQIGQDDEAQILYRKGIEDQHCGTLWYTFFAIRDNQQWKILRIITKNWFDFNFRLKDFSKPYIFTNNRIDFVSDDSRFTISRLDPNHSGTNYPNSIAFDPSGRIHLLHTRPDMYYTQQQLPSEGIRLEMDQHAFRGPYSDSEKYFYLNAYLRSYPNPRTQTPLCILLEYQQNYWFWPEWSDQFHVEYVDVNEKGSVLLAIPSFHYFKSPPQPIEGLTFWGALLNDDMTEILGGPDGIGKWEFSIR